MALTDQVIGFVSPTIAWRRAAALRQSGKEAQAFPLLVRAAKAGIADAEYGVARCYLQGTGVPPSRVEGVRWLMRAAIHDSIDAQVALASLLLQGLASEGDDQETKRQTSLLFATETATAPDFAAAAKWARKAAAVGSAQADALLGYILTSGPDSMRDLDEAHRCYERSAAAGCPQGHLGLALAMASRAVDSHSWLHVADQSRRAAEGGLPTALFMLAVMLDEGRIGIERSRELAADLYRKAAELGLRPAQYRWGLALMEAAVLSRTSLPARLGYAAPRMREKLRLRRSLAISTRAAAPCRRIIPKPRSGTAVPPKLDTRTPLVPSGQCI